MNRLNRLKNSCVLLRMPLTLVGGGGGYCTLQLFVFVFGRLLRECLLARILQVLYYCSSMSIPSAGLSDNFNFNSVRATRTARHIAFQFRTRRPRNVRRPPWHRASSPSILPIGPLPSPFRRNLSPSVCPRQNHLRARLDSRVGRGIGGRPVSLQLAVRRDLDDASGSKCYSLPFVLICRRVEAMPICSAVVFRKLVLTSRSVHLLVGHQLVIDRDHKTSCYHTPLSILCYAPPAPRSKF